jgi:hypothetical protein
MEMQDEIVKKIFENYIDFQKIAVPLMVLLGLNLLAFIGKFIADYILKNREIKIHKLNIISSRRIDIQEKLFQRLEALSLFSNENREVFLEEIQNVEIFINQNKLYLDKKMYRQSNVILDYYKGVYFDVRKKQYENEIILLDEFSRLFNK